MRRRSIPPALHAHARHFVRSAGALALASSAVESCFDMTAPRPADAPPPSSWHARALKWIGIVTAVISLLLGVRQLTSWIGDVYGRQREAATLVNVAHQQASRGEFAAAWASLDRAAEVRAGEAVDAARVEIAFAWLQDARPGPGQRFAVITDAVTPALDRALVSAAGERRADLLAHLGWVTFLRLRDGYEGDPALRYQEALAIDPDNVFANAMLGHWLLWRGPSQMDAARERFDVALAVAGDRRPFVRRLQLAALRNRNEAGDAELLRVANDMRTRNERLDAGGADYMYWIFTMRYGPNAPRTSRSGTLSDQDLAATYDWVVEASPSAQRSGVRESVRAALRDGGSR